jgi:hypothetical protein
MLDFLKEFSKEEHDAIFFLPGDKMDQVQVEAVTYKNPGESIGGSYLGHAYHVILFKEDTKVDKLYAVDRFDAIFLDPFEYISGLIPHNWFGVIARKTTTSNTFIQKTFDKLKEV